jgi:hypothetical protein
MSGGHYDYVYSKIQGIYIDKGQEPIKERVWFQKLLKLVADAMHDIEWVDSGDYGEGDEMDAIYRIRDFVIKNKLNRSVK